MGGVGFDGRFDGSHRGSTYQRIELITGERRRRRWTLEEKAAILVESCQPGASVADVARRHGLNRNLLGTWRRQMQTRVGGGVAAFVPVRITEEAALSRPEPAGREQETSPGLAGRPGAIGSGPVAGSIEIEIGGARIRISGVVDASTLRQVLAQLRQWP